MKVENYLSQVQLHLKNKTAIEIASLLNLAFLPKSLKQSFSKAPNIVNSTLPDEWRGICGLHLQAAVAFSDSLYMEAFQYQREMLLQVQKIFAGCDSWILPIVHSVSEDLWKCALLTRDVPTKEEASRLINRSFNISVNDRSGKDDSSSRKMGVFRLINLLFRIYYDLDQLNLCHNLIKVLKNTQLPPLNLFPKAHLCTFYFFHGRTLLIGGKFSEALGELENSLELCHRKSERNVTLILELVIPLKILVQGRKPSPALLATLPEYIGVLVKVITVGDYGRFFGILETNGPRLYSLGAMFAWERLGLFCRRNAFLRIFNLFGRNTRLPLSFFSPVFSNSTSNNNEDFEKRILEENRIVTTFASLISCGLVKAYVSLERKFVVFSAKDPFPINIPSAPLFPL